MSNVPKGDRGKSSAQFTQTATEIWNHIYDVSSKIPKKYYHSIGDPMRKMANAIAIYVKQANTHFPTSKSEIEIRRNYLLKAREQCFTLSYFFDLVQPKCNISDFMTHKAQSLIGYEINLITGVLDSDVKKSKTLTD